MSFVTTKVHLSQQNFCCNKYMFVVANIGRDKSFVATNTCHNKRIFVAQLALCRRLTCHDNSPGAHSASRDDLASSSTPTHAAADDGDDARDDQNAHHRQAHNQGDAANTQAMHINTSDSQQMLIQNHLKSEPVMLNQLHCACSYCIYLKMCMVSSLVYNLQSNCA